MPSSPQTIFYHEGNQNPQQALDLYLPPSAKSARLLVFIHGGAWISDDKSDFAPIGKYFSSKGFAVALVNYRLSGKESAVRHPDHTLDVVAALHWLTHHAGQYGIDPLRFYVMGFSAGANIAGLLALSPHFSLPSDAIRGYIGLEGIYDIPQLVKVWPTYEDWFVKLAFGPDRKVWQAASPQLLPSSKRHPWLLVHSPQDELVDLRQSEQFASHLKTGRVPVELFTGIQASHYGVIRAVGTEGDPTTAMILKFISQ